MSPIEKRQEDDRCQMSGARGAPRGQCAVERSRRGLRTAAEILGQHLRRLPDGETGGRDRWTGWTFPIAYEGNPHLEIVPPRDDAYTAWPLARLQPGAEDDLRFPAIGFEREALASYARFRELKDAGVVPSHVQFQVCVATPVASMILLVEPESRPAVERAYERDLMAEIVASPSRSRTTSCRSSSTSARRSASGRATTAPGTTIRRPARSSGWSATRRPSPLRSASATTSATATTSTGTSWSPRTPRCCATWQTASPTGSPGP